MLLADIVLFFYDKLKGDTPYYYWQKTSRNGEYFSYFDRKIRNYEKYTRKIESNTDYVKETFKNKKHITSENSIEIYWRRA